MMSAYAAGIISLNEMRTGLGYCEIDGGDEIPALRKMEELTVLEDSGMRWHEARPGIVSTKKVGQSYRIFFDRSEIEALGLEVGDIVQVEASVVSKAPLPRIDDATIKSVVNASKKKLTILEVCAPQAGDVRMDDMVTLVYSLNSQYRENACFLINEKTELHLRTLKDGKGAYLWQPSIQERGVVDTMLGYPVYTSKEVPEIPPNNKTGIAAIFGDVDAFLGGDPNAVVKLTVPKQAPTNLGNGQ